MHESLVDLLRCPYCGTRVSLASTDGLVRDGARVESGVLGCECCAFPVVAGIPILIADDAVREAMHALEAGRHEQALLLALGLDADAARAARFRALFEGAAPATYREAIAALSPDAEGTYFVYRFSDPTYVVAEGLLRAIGQQRPSQAGRSLDLCGGSGHLTRVLAGLPIEDAAGRPAPGRVLADVQFWKLWLARRFIAPRSAAVCCDANHPLPFARRTFSTVVLSDAFPYIWHKRLLAEEMMRVVGPDGLIVMPHLHSACGENVAAGDTLSPAAYRSLFAPLEPRLFADSDLLRQVVDRREIDLTREASPTELAVEPSVTLMASRRAGLFGRYQVPAEWPLLGELRVNPLYRVERRGDSTRLTLAFPTPEYAEEFRASTRYLPDSVTLDIDVSKPIRPEALGSDYGELRRRRVLIDVPRHYC